MKNTTIAQTIRMISVSTALLAVSALAQTWTGGGGADTNWSNAANWDEAPDFQSNPTLTLTGTSNYTSNVDEAVTLTRLNFNPAGGNATLTGQELTFKAGASGTTQLIFVGPSSASGVVTIKNDIKLLGTGAIQSSTRNLTLDGNITLTTSQVQFSSNAGRILALNGVISGVTSTLAFTGHLAGTGRTLINNSNTYTGITAIWTGGVVLTVDALTTGGAFGVSDTTVLLGTNANSQSYNPSLLTGAAVTVARNVNVVTNTSGGNVTATLGGDTAHVSTYSGDITLGSANVAGNGLKLTAAANGRVNITGDILRASGATGNTDTITKTGEGIVAIAGAGNTWAGATTVNQGTLLVNGTLSTIAGSDAAVTVSSGATLGGTGTVGRTTTILGGAFLAIGDNNAALAGPLTITGNVDFADTSTVKFDLGSSQAASDRLVVNGSVTFNGTVTFDLTTLAGFGGSATYTLLTATGGLSGSLSSITFTGADPGEYQVVIDANSIRLVSSSAIPEPRATGLVIGGGLLAGVFLTICGRRKLRR